MSYSIRYEPKRCIVRIEVETSVNASLARAMTLDAVKLARVQDCKSLLYVFREAEVSETTMGIYEFARSLPELGIDPSYRMACVIPRQDPDHRFFETVAKNQGYDVRNFTDVSDAEDWLSQGRSPVGGGKPPRA